MTNGFNASQLQTHNMTDTAGIEACGSYNILPKKALGPQCLKESCKPSAKLHISVLALTLLHESVAAQTPHKQECAFIERFNTINDTWIVENFLFRTHNAKACVGG
jgi:hypothetical protein